MKTTFLAITAACLFPALASADYPLRRNISVTGDAEMKVAPERGQRPAQWSVVTARVVVVFPELLEARADEERVAAFERKLHLVIIAQNVAGDLKTPVGIELFEHAEGFEAAIEAFRNPVQLAELSFVALHRDPTDGRRDFRNGFARWRAVAPRRILINPRTQQPDLCCGERFAFAFGRHLHVSDETRDVMDERALRTLTENDGWTVRTAFQ